MKEKRIDFGDRNYSAIAQDHHLEWAGNPNFPDYMRIVFVAYGRHAANGHAVLERGELARFLVRKDGTIPDRRQVWSSMNKAIQLGYLMAGSKAECLIVNRANVQGGRGDKDAPCHRKHKTRSRKVTVARGEGGQFAASDGAESRHSSESDGPETGHSGSSDGAEARHFTLSPSLSSLSRRDSDGTPNVTPLREESSA